MSWQLHIPYRSLDEPLDAGSIWALPKLLDSDEDALVTRELLALVCRAGAKTVGQVVDIVDSLDAADRRLFIDACRKSAGLRTATEIDARRAFELANRASQARGTSSSSTARIATGFRSRRRARWPDPGAPLALSDTRISRSRATSRTGHRRGGTRIAARSSRLPTRPSSRANASGPRHAATHVRPRPPTAQSRPRTAGSTRKLSPTRPGGWCRQGCGHHPASPADRARTWTRHRRSDRGVASREVWAPPPPDFDGVPPENPDELAGCVLSRHATAGPRRSRCWAARSPRVNPHRPGLSVRAPTTNESSRTSSATRTNSPISSTSVTRTQSSRAPSSNTCACSRPS